MGQVGKDILSLLVMVLAVSSCRLQHGMTVAVSDVEETNNEYHCLTVRENGVEVRATMFEPLNRPQCLVDSVETLIYEEMQKSLAERRIAVDNLCNDSHGHFRSLAADTARVDLDVTKEALQAKYVSYHLSKALLHFPYMSISSDTALTFRRADGRRLAKKDILQVPYTDEFLEIVKSALLDCIEVGSRIVPAMPKDEIMERLSHESIRGSLEQSDVCLGDTGVIIYYHSLDNFMLRPGSYDVYGKPQCICILDIPYRKIRNFIKEDALLLVESTYVDERKYVNSGKKLCMEYIMKYGDKPMTPHMLVTCNNDKGISVEFSDGKVHMVSNAQPLSVEGMDAMLLCSKDILDLLEIGLDKLQSHCYVGNLKIISISLDCIPELLKEASIQTNKNEVTMDQQMSDYIANTSFVHDINKIISRHGLHVTSVTAVNQNDTHNTDTCGNVRGVKVDTLQQQGSLKYRIEIKTDKNSQ